MLLELAVQLETSCCFDTTLSIINVFEHSQKKGLQLYADHQNLETLGLFWYQKCNCSQNQYGTQSPVDDHLTLGKKKYLYVTSRAFIALWKISQRSKSESKKNNLKKLENRKNNVDDKKKKSLSYQLLWVFSQWRCRCNTSLLRNWVFVWG